LLFEQLQFRSVAGPSALNGIVSSSITPNITYNTISNPQNPTSGKSYFYSLGFSGGPLGGNVNSISNVFDWKYYRPINKKRNVLGFHATAAFITGYGGKEVPPFSRFYMGGENDIRGFDIRSISPVTFIPTATRQQFVYTDPTSLSSQGFPIQRVLSVPVLGYTITFPGGDLQTFGNFEYRIPIAGPVTAGLFMDVGTVGIVRQGGLRLDPTGFENLLSQFPNAQSQVGLQRQLSIAEGTNFRVRASTGAELVVQLPIIQAPFRIYYAFNLNRLHTQITAPPDYIEQSSIDFVKNDPALKDFYRFQFAPTLNQFIQNPGRLNYFEPLRTFRFTVSRTF
jgi:outer membrane protein insertion porin family